MAGLGGNRSVEDEELIKTMSPVVIFDARSWVAAQGNKTRGGGTENANNYNCKLVMLDIENIHKVRKTYKSMKLLCME